MSRLRSIGEYDRQMDRQTTGISSCLPWDRPNRRPWYGGFLLLSEHSDCTKHTDLQDREQWGLIPAQSSRSIPCVTAPPPQVPSVTGVRLCNCTTMRARVHLPWGVERVKSDHTLCQSHFQKAIGQVIVIGNSSDENRRPNMQTGHTCSGSLLSPAVQLKDVNRNLPTCNGLQIIIHYWFFRWQS